MVLLLLLDTVDVSLMPFEDFLSMWHHHHGSWDFFVVVEFAKSGSNLMEELLEVEEVDHDLWQAKD